MLVRRLYKTKSQKEDCIQLIKSDNSGRAMVSISEHFGYARGDKLVLTLVREEIAFLSRKATREPANHETQSTAVEIEKRSSYSLNGRFLNNLQDRWFVLSETSPDC